MTKKQLKPEPNGGKKLSAYIKGGFNIRSSRRFSINHSSSSDDNVGYTSESDSSLTAVLENELSDKSSVLFEEEIINNSLTHSGKGTKGKGTKGKRTQQQVIKGKSLKGKGKSLKNYHPEDSDEEAISFVSSSDEDIDSSSDDENIDFVKLQSQKKVRVLNGTVINRDFDGKATSSPTRTKSVTKPKYGRRRSMSALPENINFEFEFQNNDNGVDDSDVNDNDDNNDDSLDGGDENVDIENEEDLGEAVYELDVINNNELEADLDFNIHIPQFNDEDMNSDEDYEIDDNELLATLQADNDLEELNNSISRRNNSITSMDDDEDQFLKQEEKLLVNEFENNGFDEEEITKVPSAAYDSDLEDDLEEDEDDEDDYHDMVDFTLDLNENEFNSGKKVSKIKRKGVDTDDEDDSYLWDYFFSSDNDSEDDQGLKSVDNSHLSIIPANEDDDNYDTGESTDIDSNVPLSNNTIPGSQKAKEVLSSKTADYRPPRLGTWMALESKPFSIIDGLSTRSLNSINRINTISKTMKRRKSFVGTPHSEESPLGLDELLNISEMDYDDTDDVKIWRDFNNQKKRVPLGAFRNKAYLQNALGNEILSLNMHYSSKANNDYQRKYHHPKKPKRISPVPPKLKRRRASRTEAFKEGYRPTKAGLFNEQALIDVEELLSDDNDIMALIKGL